MSDHELAEAHGQTGDPWYFEGLKAEQARRTAEKTFQTAKKSNLIAFASMAIACGSLIVSILAMLSSE